MSRPESALAMGQPTAIGAMAAPASGGLAEYALRVERDERHDADHRRPATVERTLDVASTRVAKRCGGSIGSFARMLDEDEGDRASAMLPGQEESTA